MIQMYAYGYGGIALVDRDTQKKQDVCIVAAAPFGMLEEHLAGPSITAMAAPA
jgi:hypothetical protein